MKKTYRSNEKNEQGISKKIATLRDDKNGLFYTFTYEFPMHGPEQTTACSKEANRFNTQGEAIEFLKKFFA